MVNKKKAEKYKVGQKLTFGKYSFRVSRKYDDYNYIDLDPVELKENGITSYGLTELDKNNYALSTGRDLFYQWSYKTIRIKNTAKIVLLPGNETINTTAKKFFKKWDGKDKNAVTYNHMPYCDYSTIEKIDKTGSITEITFYAAG